MSQFPLTRLAAKYNEMQENGRLLSNKATLAVIRDRIRQLAERIDLNEAPDRLANLQLKWDEYKKSRGTPDEVRARTEIDNEFEKAYHDYAAWKQMMEAIDLDRKLVESEVKITKEIHAVLTAEDAYNLSAKLLGAIIQTVNAAEISDDQKVYMLRRIQYEFTTIVGDKSDERTRRGFQEDQDSESGSVDREEFLHPGNQD